MSSFAAPCNLQCKFGSVEGCLELLVEPSPGRSPKEQLPDECELASHLGQLEGWYKLWLSNTPKGRSHKMLGQAIEVATPLHDAT